MQRSFVRAPPPHSSTERRVAPLTNLRLGPKSLYAKSGPIRFSRWKISCCPTMVTLVGGGGGLLLLRCTAFLIVERTKFDFSSPRTVQPPVENPNVSGLEMERDCRFRSSSRSRKTSNFLRGVRL